MGGLRHKGKTLLGVVNKLFVFKSLLTTSTNGLPLQKAAAIQMLTTIWRVIRSNLLFLLKFSQLYWNCCWWSSNGLLPQIKPQPNSCQNPIIDYLFQPSDRCRTPPWPLLLPQQPLNSTNRLPLRPLTYKNPWTRGSAGVQPPWELGVHYQVCTLHFLVIKQV